MDSSARAGAGADGNPVDGVIGAGATNTCTVLAVLEDEALALPLWIKGLVSASDVTPTRASAKRRFTEPLEEGE